MLALGSVIQSLGAHKGPDDSVGIPVESLSSLGPSVLSTLL